MVEIRSYKPSTEVLILAERFQNDIEVSTTICILKFVQISGYGTKPSRIDVPQNDSIVVEY